MPSSITWEDRGLYARFEGECSIGDITKVFDQLAADPRMDSARYAIFDYLDVSGHDVTELETEHAAALDIGLSFTNPRLLLASVSTDARVRELWRHYISVNVKTERHGLFDTVAQARAWIAARAGV